MRDHKGRVDEEIVSIDSLVHYLRQHCGYVKVSHERVKRGADPPDFWLMVDGARYAVEVTSIVVEGRYHANCRQYVGPDDAKWEGEAQDDLAKLIQVAIYKKRAAFEKKPLAIGCAGAVLVLYDLYGFGSPEDAQVALNRATGYDWFCAVFWVASFTSRTNVLAPESLGRMGAFLYCNVNSWTIPDPESKSN